jgi:hypothetical protein
MEKYGYTGSACIPMALDGTIELGKIKRGDLVVIQFRARIQPSSGGGSYDRLINSGDRSCRHKPRLAASIQAPPKTASRQTT